VNTAPVLFESQEDYDAFCQRHNSQHPPEYDIATYTGDAYLGIDAGSTTTKMALIAPDGGLLYSYYHSNLGNPVAIVREQLNIIYGMIGDRITIKGSAVTGYGEDLIKNAFRCDLGLVETVAHYKAAAHFNPEVDFIIDIGGQDMKCFKIRNGAVDSIMLNEACSSGCGSFIETFARALGYNIADFAKLGLFTKKPVSLGSRCTVFMNSSVKQAQKDGASVEDISAGLSISIVKNAIYKVLRMSSADELGQHIVVQGGTFYNDAVLRAFEQELGRDVIRPTISGIMGAFGAALAARDLGLTQSTLLTREDLADFQHTAKPVTCNGCTNHCALTINTFDGGRRFISGNRCSKPLGGKKVQNPDLMKWKYEKLRTMEGKGTGTGVRGRIGIPFGLNMYENLPFWFTLLTKLNFEVVLSPESSRKLYIKGQRTIPSDTVCYPAKLLHGHVISLLEQQVDAIFYPCMSYNFDEGISDNNYNCPVVAYYPDLLATNIPQLKDTKFLHPYFGIHRPKDFEKHATQFFGQEFSIPKKEVVAAVHSAYAAYDDYKNEVRGMGREYIAYARAHDMPVLVVAGRPYHMDPEINHGINDLITGFNFALVTEDAVAWQMDKAPRTVLNQWTYHARMYNAARYVCTQDDMQLIQLVSFGCGVDAITTDEVRSILEEGGKLYTQLKIDDISNLGAVRIRIRSLIAAMEARKTQS
jgi:predicted CoA-substrate-specific enzyme activase